MYLPAPRVIRDLHLALHDPDPFVRCYAARDLIWANQTDSRVIEPLIPLLDDPKIRDLVFNALSSAEAPARFALPKLNSLLQDPDPWVRAASIHTISKISGDSMNPATLKVLFQLTEDKNDSVSEAALKAIGRVSFLEKTNSASQEDWAIYLPALLKALHHSDQRIRRSAAEALKFFARPGVKAERDIPKVITSLGLQLEDRNAQVVAAAAESLSYFESSASPAVSTLVKCLSRKEPLVLIKACRALGAIGEKAKPALPAMIPLLNHRIVEVEEKAGESLRKISPLFGSILEYRYNDFAESTYNQFATELLKEEGAVDTLIALVATNKQYGKIYRSIVLLGLLDKHPHIAKAIPVLKQLLQGDEPNYQIAAAKALGKLGYKEGVSHLARLFLENSDDFDIRIHALEALCHLGEIPQEVAEKMESFLEADIARYRERTYINQIPYTLASAGKVAFKTVPAITAFMLKEKLDYYDRNLGVGAETLVSLGFPELANLKFWQNRSSYLDRFDDHEEWVAARAIADINPANREYVGSALIAVLKNGKEQTCRVAVKAIREMGEKGIKALPALIEKLRSTGEPNLKIEIFQAIAAMGSKATGALPELTNCLVDKLPEVRVGAANAISALGTAAVSVAPEIRKYIPRENGEIKATFVSALGSIVSRDGSEVPHFIQLLQDPEIKVRIAAAKALGKQGKAARDALPYLKILSESGDILMRLAATEAIQNIQR